MVTINEEDYLEHYGTPRRSGRYPWGSGGEENAAFPRNADFLDHVRALRKKGVTEAEIAEGMGMKTTELRALTTIAKNQVKQDDILTAQKLKAKGMSNVAIGQQMGKPESSIRAMLAPGEREKADALTATANFLREKVDTGGMLDVGIGVERYLNISKERLATAVAMLKAEGYELHTGITNPQIGTGKDTQLKILAPPGTTWADAARNKHSLQQIREFTPDNGKTWETFQTPIAVNPRRVGVVYAEDGGAMADGVIYVRPGKKDLSLGNNQYAQVRIQVGDGHFLKGMAMYKDDLPPGVDLQFNTNKSKADAKSKLDVMKPLKDDADLPFGSIVSQIRNDKGKVTSAMNLVNEQGDWEKWSKNLSSQMLSKQSPRLAKEQLDLTHERRKKEFEEIKALTNPTVRKKLLEEFAKSTDSAAVHLKAAHMPRQATKVILPINSLKDTEVFAPTFKNGERVVLIRFPHGGVFEIPELTVNNGNREGRKLIGSGALDAIGINHKVAQHLSGADFDGDTVLVIPNNLGKIKNSPALSQLKDFDPQIYKIPEGSGIKKMGARTKGIEMGSVSNLITDMTIKKASHEELARAVRHSMVVIDAEKHGLDWRKSAQDNNIKDLKLRYQGTTRGGADTLISKKKSYEMLPETKLRPASEGGPFDPKTGRRVFVETGKTKVTKDGTRVPVLEKRNKLDRTEDAGDLSSGTTMEKVYADHSNKLKDLGNRARVAAFNTPRLNYSASAKKAYSSEVASLDHKLALALMNAPRERQAQLVAQATIKMKRQAHPEMTQEQLQKVKYQALNDARIRLGAGKEKVEITPREWEAIQAGAISNNKLEDILRNTDLDAVKAYATPRSEPTMSTSLTQRAQSMLSTGYTSAEVAEQLGVSVTTLSRALDEAP